MEVEVIAFSEIKHKGTSSVCVKSYRKSKKNVDSLWMGEQGIETREQQKALPLIRVEPPCDDGQKFVCYPVEQIPFLSQNS